MQHHSATELGLVGPEGHLTVSLQMKRPARHGVPLVVVWRQHRRPQFGHRRRVVPGNVHIEITGRDGVPGDDAARLVDKQRIPGVEHGLPVEKSTDPLRSGGEAELGETAEPLLL